MKLLRYGEIGSERPGLLDGSGRVRDLSAIVSDIASDTVSPEKLAELRRIDPESLPMVEAGVRMGACIAGVRNFYGVGRNYRDHAEETKMDLPKEAVLFNKATSCIAGPDDDVVIPKSAAKVDAEVELAVVMGASAYDVAEEDALQYVAGYCVCNDLSERAWQLEGTGNTVKGKSAPTFGPLGPWLVTTDEIHDPQQLQVFLDVNGERRQTGHTSMMIFGVKHLVAFASRFMTLLPGDIIATGTPSGVGLTMQPPVFLKPGDVIRLGVEKLGEQMQTCVVGTR